MVGLLGGAGPLAGRRRAGLPGRRRRSFDVGAPATPRPTTWAATPSRPAAEAATRAGTAIAPVPPGTRAAVARPTAAAAATLFLVDRLGGALAGEHVAPVDPAFHADPAVGGVRL